jgi:hypothetical protein
MLIMTYAYARATGDGSLISRYVSRCLGEVHIRLTDLVSIEC